MRLDEWPYRFPRGRFVDLHIRDHPALRYK